MPNSVTKTWRRAKAMNEVRSSLGREDIPSFPSFRRRVLAARLA
jgi:hypothetical protein